MAYTPVTFVYGEVLTAAKMNILAANDASFHDGSGLPEISVLNRVYPVGSIFMSATLSTAAAVAAALGGGTWQAWGKGRVPVGVDTAQTEFDTVEETGGAKTHTLTTQEMPSHRHEIKAINDTGGYAAGVLNLGKTLSLASNPPYTANTQYAGDGHAHNNLQPYITCYMWKRTA